MLKGFKFEIGTGKDFITIENTDRSGHVTFIESSGKSYDLTNAEFVMFVDSLMIEAQKIKEELEKETPDKASFKVVNDND